MVSPKPSPADEGEPAQGRERITEEDLISYLPLVKRIVGRMAVSLPSFFDREDLLMSGVVGLVQAYRGFDPARGVKFATYAAPRIRGAVLDALREAGPLSPTVLARLREATEAAERLAGDGEGEATGAAGWEARLAAELGRSERDLARLWSQLQLLSMVSLEEVLAGEGQRLSQESSLTASAGSGPEEAYLERELGRRLARAVAGLEERDRLVLSLYYVQQLTLREIAEVLGVTESRVCQLHHRALERLRRQLN